MGRLCTQRLYGPGLRAQPQHAAWAWTRAGCRPGEGGGSDGDPLVCPARHKAWGRFTGSWGTGVGGLTPAPSCPGWRSAPPRTEQA